MILRQHHSTLQNYNTLTPVLTRDNMMRSFRANVSPCFILIRFLSRHFMAYILPVSALRHPYTSPNPPRPMIRWTLKSFMVSWGSKVLWTQIIHENNTMLWKLEIKSYFLLLHTRIHKLSNLKYILLIKCLTLQDLCMCCILHMHVIVIYH